LSLAHGTIYPQTFALTWPTSGGRSAGIVRSRTQAREYVCFFIFRLWHIVVPLQPGKNPFAVQLNNNNNNNINNDTCYFHGWVLRLLENRKTLTHDNQKIEYGETVSFRAGL
jgi:hypothetical protein